MTVTPRARQARAIEKKRQILDAAVALIFEKGVQGVTHRQVASRAEVPVGSIGYYYNTREDLLVIAIAEVGRRRRRVADTILRDLRGPQSPEATADLLLRVIVGGEPSGDLLAGWLAAIVDGLRESKALSDSLDQLRRDVYADIRRLLDDTGYPGVEETCVNARVSGAVLVSVIERRGEVLDSVREALLPLLGGATGSAVGQFGGDVHADAAQGQPPVPSG